MIAPALSAQTAVGDVAPNFKFDKVWNGDGDKDELTDYRGSLVIVEVWATW
jgi:hypothetical protein